MLARLKSVFFIILGMVSLLITGCATNPEIVKFGAAATALADSYKPILSTPSRLCLENAALESFAIEEKYNLQELKKAANESSDCKHLSEAQATRVVVADAIAAYGQALSVLAGADSTALTPDINGVATAAKGIKDKGGDASFDANRVDALATFVSTLVQWARAAEARRTARDLMTRAQPPLASLVEEMKNWTEGTVIPRLEKSISRRTFVLKALVDQSTASDPVKPLQTYPMRVGQETILQKIESLEAEKQAATAFITAATGLVKTHQALLDSFDASNKEAQVDAIRKFVDQVLALRKAADSI